MPTLRATRFTAEMQAQPDVQEFECGTTEVSRDMADWITGPRCLVSMARGTEIWLFRNDAGNLIGFGSVGRTKWSWPEPGCPSEDVAIIPAFALQSPYQGMPSDADKENKYACRIMRFLIERARTMNVPRVVLYVHPSNKAAISLYTYLLFDFLADLHKGNAKMFRELTR